MAAGLIVAIAVLAPVLADGVSTTLVAFLVLLQIAGFVAQCGRDWPVVTVVRTLPAVGALLVVLAAGDGRPAETVTAADGTLLHQDAHRFTPVDPIRLELPGAEAVVVELTDGDRILLDWDSAQTFDEVEGERIEEVVA